MKQDQFLSPPRQVGYQVGDISFSYFKTLIQCHLTPIFGSSILKSTWGDVIQAEYKLSCIAITIEPLWYSAFQELFPAAGQHDLESCGIDIVGTSWCGDFETTSMSGCYYCPNDVKRKHFPNRENFGESIVSVSV